MEGACFYCIIFVRFIKESQIVSHLYDLKKNDGFCVNENVDRRFYTQKARIVDGDDGGDTYNDLKSMYLNENTGLINCVRRKFIKNMTEMLYNRSRVALHRFYSALFFR